VTTVLLVGGDLMAKSRLVEAASRAGAILESASPDGFRARLREIDANLVVIDLDGGRDDVLNELRTVSAEELGSARVVGYYSHVDRALGAAAEQAGCEAWPRGKFWSGLDELLQARH
jgi:DNA-binding NarL/FixJ family response regulator